MTVYRILLLLHSVELIHSLAGSPWPPFYMQVKWSSWTARFMRCNRCVVIDIRRLGGYMLGVFGIHVWQRSVWLERPYISKPIGHYIYHRV